MSASSELYRTIDLLVSHVRSLEKEYNLPPLDVSIPGRSKNKCCLPSFAFCKSSHSEGVCCLPSTSRCSRHVREVNLVMSYFPKRETKKTVRISNVDIVYVNHDKPDKSTMRRHRVPIVKDDDFATLADPSTDDGFDFDMEKEEDEEVNEPPISIFENVTPEEIHDEPDQIKSNDSENEMEKKMSYLMTFSQSLRNEDERKIDDKIFKRKRMHLNNDTITFDEMKKSFFIEDKNSVVYAKTSSLPIIFDFDMKETRTIGTYVSSKNEFSIGWNENFAKFCIEKKEQEDEPRRSRNVRFCASAIHDCIRYITIKFKVRIVYIKLENSRVIYVKTKNNRKVKSLLDHNEPNIENKSENKQLENKNEQSDDDIKTIKLTKVVPLVKRKIVRFEYDDEEKAIMVENNNSSNDDNKLMCMMTVNELKNICKENKYSGYTELKTKEELMKFITMCKEEPLYTKTITELKKICKEKKCRGYSRVTSEYTSKIEIKKALIKMIKNTV